MPASASGVTGGAENRERSSWLNLLSGSVPAARPVDSAYLTGIGPSERLPPPSVRRRCLQRVAYCATTKLDAAVLLLALAEVGNQGLLRAHALGNHAVRRNALVGQVLRNRLGLIVSQGLGLGRGQPTIPVRFDADLPNLGVIDQDVHHLVEQVRHAGRRARRTACRIRS